MASKTPFTEDEDSLLVKYIAKYNPSTKGRSGNVLYRTLCEDADNKWKWSRTHPWQSWRDHYCKNQRHFDNQIKKYQIKHDLLPTDEDMHGKSPKEQLVSRYKRKREHEREEKRARVRHDPGNQVPASGTVEPTVIDQSKGKAVANYTEDDPALDDKFTQDVASVDVVKQEVENRDEPGLPASTMTISPSLLYSDVNEPVSPTTESNSVNQKSSMTERQRISPITYQKSHRAVLADSQPVASTSKVHMVSNSRRRKPVMEDDVFFEPSPTAQSPNSPRNIIRSKHKKPKLVEGPFGTRFACRQKSSGSVNDSSEDEEATAAWPPPRRRSNAKGKGKLIEAANPVAGAVPNDGETKPNVFPASMRRTAVDQHQPWKASPTSMNGFDKGQEEVDKSTSLQRQWGRIEHPLHRETCQEVNETPDQRCLEVSLGTSYDILNLNSATKAESSATGRKSMKPLLSRHSWTPNPFRSTDGAIIRRHSMGNLREVQSSTVRRLDLRVEMAKRRFAASSPFNNSRGHSIASTMPYQSSPMSSHNRTDNGHRERPSIRVADEDREHIEFLGLKHAIEGIAQETGFLVEQVWRVYDHYPSIRRTKEWIRLYRENSVRIQELTHEQMTNKGLGALASSDEQRTSWSSYLEHNQKREASTEHTLSTPETLESWFKPLPADLQRLPSEYSPPHETRAGEYNRLVGQGRVEEAMLREHRRASGSGGVFPRLRWGTPHQSSPSNGTESDGEEVEDADNVTLFGRSKGQTELQEEEEMLFLSACAGTTDRLRVIEQKMDPDYMLRWVAAQLGGMADEFRSCNDL